MRNLYYLLIIGLFFISCKNEFKKCDIKTNDIYLKVYNDILNEIIIKSTYNRYLGKNEKKIFKMYDNIYKHGYRDSNEIEKIHNEVIALHNELFGDTTQFCDIYLGNKLKYSLSTLPRFETDTNAYTRKLENAIMEFPANREAILKSVSSPQSKYHAKDFKCGVANIRSSERISNVPTKCYIGAISFSNLILNKESDRGLLYYEFKCGGLCGYGRLIAIKKVGSFWEIEESFDTWVS